MRKSQRGWTMPEEDARSMLRLVEERIRSSDIQIEHRDALIRLRAMIEDDLAAYQQDRASEAGSAEAASKRATWVSRRGRSPWCRPQPTCLTIKNSPPLSSGRRQ